MAALDYSLVPGNLRQSLEAIYEEAAKRGGEMTANAEESRGLRLLLGGTLLDKSADVLLDGLAALRSELSEAATSDRRKCSECSIPFSSGYTDGCGRCSARRRQAESRARRKP